MFRWLRDYARVKTLFIDPHFAAYAKNRIALTYAFLGWNIFGLIVYKIFKEKIPNTRDSADYAKLLGVKDAKVLRFSDLSKVEEYELNVSDEELTQFKNVIGNPEEKDIYDKKNEERRKVGKAKQ